MTASASGATVGDDNNTAAIVRRDPTCGRLRLRRGVAGRLLTLAGQLAAAVQNNDLSVTYPGNVGMGPDEINRLNDRAFDKGVAKLGPINPGG